MTTEAASTQPASSASTEPLVQAAGEGERLWFNNDLLVFRASSRQTGGAFILIEEHSQRGKATPLHLHPEESESFYILDGELRMHVDGDERVAGAGSFVSIPAGVPHAFVVTSDRARFLVLLVPGSAAAEDFFRDAGDPASGPEPPPARPLDLERIRAAAERHGSVRILGPPPFDSL